MHAFACMRRLACMRCAARGACMGRWRRMQRTSSASDTSAAGAGADETGAAAGASLRATNACIGKSSSRSSARSGCQVLPPAHMHAFACTRRLACMRCAARGACMRRWRRMQRTCQASEWRRGDVRSSRCMRASWTSVLSCLFETAMAASTALNCLRLHFPLSASPPSSQLNR